MKRFSDDAQPRIDYPTWWVYQVIGIDRRLLELAIKEIVEDRGHRVSLSNLSSKGKYCSLKLEVLVLHETERKKIYTALCKHPATTIVI